MRVRKVCVGLVLLAVTWSAGANASEPVPADTAPPQLHLSCSGAAEPARLRLACFWPQLSDLGTPTDVDVSCDGDTLRVIFWASDTDILSTRTGRDSETFRDDCVEIFLALPEDKPRTAFGIEVNTNGVVSDYIYRHKDQVNPRPDLESLTVDIEPFDEPPPGVSFQGPGFRATLTLSLAEVAHLLGGETAPRTWRVNFSRWNHPGGQRVLSLWSDPQLMRQHPHNLTRYGWLFLKEEDGK